MGLPNISPKPCFPVCGVHQGQSPLAQESRPASWRDLEALLTPAPSGGSAAQPTPASSRAANSFKTRSQAQPARCQPHRTNFFPSSSKSSAAFSCKSQHEVSNAPGCCQGKPPEGAGPGSSQVHTSRRDGKRRFLRVSLAGAPPRPVIAPLNPSAHSTNSASARPKLRHVASRAQRGRARWTFQELHRVLAAQGRREARRRF